MLEVVGKLHLDLSGSQKVECAAQIRHQNPKNIDQTITYLL